MIAMSKSTQEIQQEIVNEIVSGGYDNNLRLAIKYAAMAVEADSEGMINYLLLQSIAQSQIAQAVLLEEVVGLLLSTTEEGE